MLTNRPGRPGVLMEDLPWMNIQPVTSLIIQASLPKMTRVLLGARVAFYIQGVQCLDAPWSKSVQPDAILEHSTLPSSSCPYLPTPCSQPVVYSVWRGPSKQGSFTPTKDLPQFKGRTVTRSAVLM